MLKREPETGHWRYPLFFDLAGPTLGPQFGAQKSEVVMVIMNEQALDQILTGYAKLGADIRMVAGLQDLGTEAATTGEGSEIRVFARSTGLFAGAAVKGAILSAKDDWNTMYYGKSVTPSEILRGGLAENQAAHDLRVVLMNAAAASKGENRAGLSEERDGPAERK